MKLQIIFILISDPLFLLENTDVIQKKVEMSKVVEVLTRHWDWCLLATLAPTWHGPDFCLVYSVGDRACPLLVILTLKCIQNSLQGINITEIKLELQAHLAMHCSHLPKYLKYSVNILIWLRLQLKLVLSLRSPEKAEVTAFIFRCWLTCHS